MPNVADADNAQAHLDLAIAYTEMGLHADARREAIVALRTARTQAIVEKAMELLQLSTEPGDGPLD